MDNIVFIDGNIDQAVTLSTLFLNFISQCDSNGAPKSLDPTVKVINRAEPKKSIQLTVDQGNK